VKVKNATTDWELIEDYRYPRTREEAYGYWTEVLPEEQRDPPMDWQDKVVLSASLIAFLFVLWIVLL
jgi:hypothetical protein